MDLFSLLYKHFWLIGIGVVFFNGFLLKERFKDYIKHYPSLEEGYIKIYRGFVFFGSLPLVAMGIGMIFGGFQSVDELMHGVRLDNPFVLLFYGTLMSVWLLAVMWICFLGGAEFLSEHPGVFRGKGISSEMLKTRMILSLAGAAIFIILNLYT